MRLIRLALALLVFVSLIAGLPADGTADDSVLTCTFSRQAVFDVFPGRTKAPKVNQVRYAVRFSGLESGTPTIAIEGITGTSKLKLLRYDDQAIWMAENPIYRDVNIWSVFLKKKVAILSKQYEMGGQAHGLMATGTCK